MPTIQKSFLITEEMKQIVSDDNFLFGLCLSDHNIVLLMNWRGGPMVSYAMYYKNEVLFTGTDFKPSPLYDIDDLQSGLDLLSFLTVQPGDTDKEYFSNYVPEQLAFAESYTAEVVKCLISDTQDKDSEYQAEAAAYFESCRIDCI